MRGAQRAAALTSRLLAFSRRQALDPKPIELNKFLAGVGDFLQRSLGENIEIQTVGSAGLWQVEADVGQLESALVNVAINARDAMPTGGKLTIEATNIFADESYCRSNPEVSPGQYVLICVSDTGTGMPEHVAARAFEPFFTTKELGQGTGLGLSQVYGFVKQSGGNVKIYSETGEGTTIKIYLPRYLGAEDTNARSIEDDDVALSDSDELILVVEDNDDLRAYISEVLRNLGYRVLTASSGQAAISILTKSPARVDLLLTDIIMPGMNGRELAKHALALRPDLRILYMSGYSRNAVMQQGRLEPGIDLLQKPVSQTILASRVRDLLDKRIIN
jgi:CheY-like chemotaxis protein